MRTLVLGATGTVGSHVVRGLLARGAQVRIITRDGGKAGKQPPGVEARVGDLTSPRELGPAFEGVERLFLLNAVSISETQEGLSALEWAKRAGVAKLVYVSVHHVAEGPHIPHFASKIVIEEAIRRSGIEYTILRPGSYFQNDYALKDAMLGYGQYPHPLGGAGASRVDVRDIADAAVNALTTGAYANAICPLVGPDALTGEQCAAIWTRHLGRPVRYAGDDLEAWEQQVVQFLPGWMAFDLRLMFAHFQRHGFRATPDDVAQTAQAAGHPPRTFDDFVAETARAWL